MKAVFEYKETLSSDVSSFWFRPEEGFSYIAGQFIELHLPHNSDQRGEKRWFTLSSSPTNKLISITTKFSNKPSSYKQTLNELKPGDIVGISDSMGDFVLPKNPRTPLIFVAVGIGITPFYSMITWLRDKGQSRNIKLLYAVRSESDLIFYDSLRSLVEVIPIIKQGSSSWQGETGSLSANAIMSLAQLTPQTKIYLSGPEKLVESLTKDLIIQHGLDQQKVITDYFLGYA